MRGFRIALAGKPNSGKSSLFNRLTGLSQKVANFPGVTVDKKVGFCRLDKTVTVELIDLPGSYSLYPRSGDEKIVADILLDKKNDHFPNALIVVADATNLQGSLLLVSQLIDLGFPMILVVSMMDLASKAGQVIAIDILATSLDIPVVPINARTGEGIEELKIKIKTSVRPSSKNIYKMEEQLMPATDQIKAHFKLSRAYEAYQYLQQADTLRFLSEQDKHFISKIATQYSFVGDLYQGTEIIFRYKFIQDLLHKTTSKERNLQGKKYSSRIDGILTHKLWGYLIFFGVLVFMFQSVFALAQIPMDWIDKAFAMTGHVLAQRFPKGPFFDLITQGVLPGLGGIVIFIPQIAILFFFIAILEETGYMSRVVFLMDRIMRKFGMNGKSLVPLISGWACAIPAIMATRTIENEKDRLITILVTPFMSCSARIPVYTILIALIIPESYQLGFLNVQGLTLVALYLLGFLAAIISAWGIKKIIKSKNKDFLFIELPIYRRPHWPNVVLTIVQRTKAFVFGAGKVILAISVILWALANYGPPGQMEKAEERIQQEWAMGFVRDEDEAEHKRLTYRLENSYVGILGKTIEPIIAPLGYDWKIGIALIASFAAREVFVGTMATIYSLGTTDDQTTLKNRLKKEKNPDTGKPRFTVALGLSLLIFYAFAMQCVSTLAVVKRETKGWKWPFIQLIYMTGMAYGSAWITYQVFS